MKALVGQKKGFYFDFIKLIYFSVALDKIFYTVYYVFENLGGYPLLCYDYFNFLGMPHTWGGVWGMPGVEVCYAQASI